MDRSSADTVALLKALADPGRLTIARVLLDGAFHVSELVEILDVGQSTVSRNLRILVEAGLLGSRREGRLVFYAWRSDALPAASALRAWVQDHAPALPQEAGRRLQAVWEARRRRIADFFEAVDASDPAAAWLGSPDCVPLLLRELPAGGTVADLGTGNGRMLPSLCAVSERVIAVDASPGLLDQARRRAQTEALAGVDFRLGDLAHLPLRTEEADAVVANMVLHHVPEPARALREMSRVLRKGGLLLLGDFLPHDQEWMRDRLADQWLGFSPPDVRRWLSDAGFEDIRLRPVPGERPGALGVFVARARASRSGPLESPSGA